MYKQQETRDILIDNLKRQAALSDVDNRVIDALVELVDFLINVAKEDLVHQINRTGEWDPDY